MDDGHLILKMQYRLLKVFHILDGPKSREYQRALATSIHLWEFWKSHGHPAWEIFQNHPSCWNEEAGELCFSVLAREIASSGVRSDHAAVARKFRLVNSKIEVAHRLQVDLEGEGFSRSSHCTILPTSPDVVATVAFFKRMIRQLTSGQHRHYGPDCGFLDATARRRQQARTTVAAETVPKLVFDTETRLRDTLNRVSVSLRAFWVYEHRDIWPGAQPRSSSDEESGDEGDDEEDEEPGDSDDPDEDDDDEAPDADPPGARSRPQRRRQRDADRCEEEAKASRFLGRMVAVPSWCLGIRWSERKFGSRQGSNRARMHGRLERSEQKNSWNCRFFHDQDYVLVLTHAQVNNYLVPVEEEGNAVDTPFVVDDTSTE